MGYGGHGYGAAGYGGTSTVSSASVWEDAVAALGINVAGWWRQGEASGTTMADSSGNGRDGIYGDAPTLGQTGLIVGDATTSASYADSADYAQVNFASWMNTSALTLVMVVKNPTSGTGKLLITRDDGVSNRVFRWNLVNGKLYFERRTPFSALQDTTTNVSDGSTHLIAAVHDGTQIRLNVDGVDVASLADANLLDTPAGGQILIGGNNVGGNVGGTVQEVLYITTALTESELAALNAARLGGATDTTVSGGQATETDVAQPVLATSAITLNVGAATESNAANLVSLAQTLTLNPATESDAAGGILPTTADIVVLGRATETDSATHPTVSLASLSIPVGQAQEISSARVIVTVLTGAVMSVGRASETDSANIFIGPQVYLLLRAVDVQEARNFGAQAPPAAGTITIRWTLYDPNMPELWTMPINPDKMDSPHFGRSLGSAEGTRQDSRVRVIDTAPQMKEWSFTGVIRTQEHHDKLHYWAQKRNPIHVKDHLGRTFEVVIKRFDPVDRRPTATVPWRGRYTMTCLLIRRVS